MSSHRATTYTVYPNRYDEYTLPGKSDWTLTVQERSEGSWSIKWNEMVLTRDRRWVYEPSPSDRDDGFLARTRFPEETAIELAGLVLDNTGVPGGITIAQAQARYDERPA